MIRKFRKYTSGLLSKLLMILLAGSFVMWGIGDMNFGKTNEVARIGSHTISAPEFQQQLSLRLANYRQLLGAEYSPEIVKRLGLPQQILSEMVNGLLLRNEAESLGIALSDSEVMKLVSSNEAFRGNDGFDKMMFESALKRNGMSEESYLKALRTETAANLLLAHLDGSALIQRPMLEALYRLRAETREATVYLFSPDSLGAAAEPGDTELSEYYEKNKNAFEAPELRKLAYIVIDPQKLREEIAIKETTLRKLYETRKETYRSPEQRKIRQLLYSSKETALEALHALQQGAAMEDVAKKIKPSNKELSLGLITAGDLVTEARDPVFALPKGGYSNVIETSFGWHIFEVNEIVSSAIPDFEKIVPQLREEILDSKLEEKLYKLATDLEDQLAGGASLADAAKEMQLTVEESAFFDAAGKLHGDKPHPLPPVKNIINRAFSGDLENTPEFQSGDDGNDYFITLAQTKPAKIPSLQEARAAVADRWKQEATARKLADKVAQVSEMLKKGKGDILKGLIYTTGHTGKITRNGHAEEGTPRLDIPQKLQQELFTLKANEYSSPHVLGDGKWAIAKLDSIHPLKAKSLSDEDLAGLSNELSEQYSDELMQLYLAHLRRKFPIQVNQALLNSLLK